MNIPTETSLSMALMFLHCRFLGVELLGQKVEILSGLLIVLINGLSESLTHVHSDEL